jgi:5-methylcytosine-specific restriction endonuclease McrA
VALGARTHRYRGRRWDDARALALQRAHYRCECCGARQVLVVHHLDEQGMDGPRAYDQANLVVLCRAHHRSAHGGKPQRD